MLIAFDLDGTLIDDMKLLAREFAKSVTKYADVEFREVYLFYFKTGGWSLQDQLSAFIKDKKLIEKITKDLIVKFDKIRMNSKLFPDVLPFISKYYKKYELVVVSGSKSDEIRKVLRHFKINQYFSEVYGWDFGRKEEILENLLKKDKVIYIGDSVYDSCLAQIVKGLNVYIRDLGVLPKEFFCRKAKIIRSLDSITIVRNSSK